MALLDSSLCLPGPFKNPLILNKFLYCNTVCSVLFLSRRCTGISKHVSTAGRWQLVSELCVYFFSWKTLLQRTITCISQPRKATSRMFDHMHLTATSRYLMLRHLTCRKLHCHLASKFLRLLTSVSFDMSCTVIFLFLPIHVLNNFIFFLQ